MASEAHCLCDPDAHRPLVLLLNTPVTPGYNNSCPDSWFEWKTKWKLQSGINTNINWFLNWDRLKTEWQGGMILNFCLYPLKLCSLIYKILFSIRKEASILSVLYAYAVICSNAQSNFHSFFTSPHPHMIKQTCLTTPERPLNATTLWQHWPRLHRVGPL